MLMSKFYDILKSTGKFIDRNGAVWDHTAWEGFLEDVSRISDEVSKQMQYNLGQTLSSMKVLYEKTADKAESIMTNLSDEIASFIEHSSGIWDHNGWQEFLRKIGERGINLSDDAVNALGSILEEAKHLYQFILSKGVEDISAPQQKSETAKPETAKEEKPKEQDASTGAVKKDAPRSKKTVKAQDKSSSSVKADPVKSAAQDKETVKIKPAFSERLTKKFLTSLDEGVFLVSASADENKKPLFSSVVPALSEREDMWKRLIEAAVNHKTCHVFKSKADYDDFVKQA
ncbi:hypothetical protein MCHI_001422 [Candidatus Magnetoovum chiemensis]|nr:hypothetical protein MCHI_001422 [Candidatus Magnetoovum chiemensis]